MSDKFFNRSRGLLWSELAVMDPLLPGAGIRRGRLLQHRCGSVIPIGWEKALTMMRDGLPKQIKVHGSMIIMGNHGRTGLTQLMLGSVAERTLRYAECLVLVVQKRTVLP
jgi:hypothetical protein